MTMYKVLRSGSDSKEIWCSHSVTHLEGKISSCSVLPDLETQCFALCVHVSLLLQCTCTRFYLVWFITGEMLGQF